MGEKNYLDTWHRRSVQKKCTHARKGEKLPCSGKERERSRQMVAPPFFHLPNSKKKRMWKELFEKIESIKCKETLSGTRKETQMEAFCNCSLPWPRWSSTFLMVRPGSAWWMVEVQIIDWSNMSYIIHIRCHIRLRSWQLSAYCETLYVRVYVCVCVHFFSIVSSWASPAVPSSGTSRRTSSSSPMPFNGSLQLDQFHPKAKDISDASALAHFVMRHSSFPASPAPNPKRKCPDVPSQHPTPPATQFSYSSDTAEHCDRLIPQRVKMMMGAGLGDGADDDDAWAWAWEKRKAIMSIVYGWSLTKPCLGFSVDATL